MKWFEEFKEFIKEFKVMSIAIAFIISQAVNSVVESLVDDMLMPVIGAFIPGGNWQQATISLGPVILNWGSFVSSLIDFVILVLIIFWFVKISKVSK